MLAEFYFADVPILLCVAAFMHELSTILERVFVAHGPTKLLLLWSHFTCRHDALERIDEEKDNNAAFARLFVVVVITVIK